MLINRSTNKQEIEQKSFVATQETVFHESVVVTNDIAERFVGVEVTSVWLQLKSNLVTCFWITTIYT
jgi:hypothetical protein